MHIICHSTPGQCLGYKSFGWKSIGKLNMPLTNSSLIAFPHCLPSVDPGSTDSRQTGYFLFKSTSHFRPSNKHFCILKRRQEGKWLTTLLTFFSPQPSTLPPCIHTKIQHGAQIMEISMSDCSHIY